MSQVGGIMEIIKALFDVYEQDLFAFIGATSWPDLFECLFSYAFIIVVLAFTLFLPLTLFFLMFLAPFL